MPASPAVETSPANRGSTPEEAMLRCGTLQYTKAGLFTLFAWLVWGDFCFTLMENVWPSILPLMLKHEGASNFLLSTVVTVIPSVMNFVLNPIISTMSDRHRSRRGRRVPFLLLATPFVTGFLILLGFSKPLGAWLHGALAGVFPHATAAAWVLGTIAVLLVGFRFFELFINTVFWYLFNDVVPVAYMGRFLGIFRVAGSLAGAAFNFLLFQYAESHTSAIFLGVAVLYGTVFFLMALKVKEGEYPPPAPREGGMAAWWAHFRAFFQECFRHRMYRLVFSYNACFYAASVANTFLVFLAFSLGLNLKEIGWLTGAAGIASVILMFPAGVLIDRLNPIRLMLVAQAGGAVAFAAKLIFLFVPMSKAAAFWVYGAALLVAVPMAVVNAMASLPMVMRVFPRERFGQFCAANAMCGAAGTVLGGLAASSLLDWSRRYFPAGGEFDYYRLVPIWSVVFTLLAAGFTWLVWREWNRLGGEEGYKPPV